MLAPRIEPAIRGLGYDAYRYLFPPRPEKAAPPSMLAMYEQQGWWAQYKLNGTCSIIAVDPDRKLHARGRHGPADRHSMWEPTLASSHAFRTLPGGWYVFVCELMHSKVAGGPRDTLYVNDILVSDGQYLVGTTFADRQDMLAALFPEPRGSARLPSHYAVTPNCWIARNHTQGFADLFASISDPCHEGLVLKKPGATLALCSRETSNVSWQAKVRRAAKNYAF